MLDLSHLLAGILLFGVSLFLILLVLVQRGKGGGLTGALGGMGGQSAFGAKAGDLFTRITVITASIWILLCMLTISFLNPPASKIETSTTSVGAGAVSDESEDADGNAEANENVVDPSDTDGDASTDEKKEPAKPIGPEAVPGGGS